MAFELSDELLATIVPIIAYWVFSGVYEVLAYLLPGSRLHSDAEEAAKNPPRWAMIKRVLTQQASQILLVALIYKVLGYRGGSTRKPQPSFLVVSWQFLVAMIVFDTWEYFSHRAVHANRFLYKRVHSVHHELLSPRSYGTYYVHWFDLTNDALGAVAAALAAGMTPRTTIYWFTLSTVRAVDLHSGLWLPWSPFQLLFSLNSAVHDSHHQLTGLHSNYSQAFFLSWDKILGTYRPCSVVKRKGGGYKAQLATKSSVTS